MFARILKRMREMALRGEYVMTTHADEEADADELSLFDVESAILTGTILERQEDRETSEWKYVIRGEALDGSTVIAVVKFGASRKLLYIITVYAE